MAYQEDFLKQTLQGWLYNKCKTQDSSSDTDSLQEILLNLSAEESEYLIRLLKVQTLTPYTHASNFPQTVYGIYGKILEKLCNCLQNYYTKKKLIDETLHIVNGLRRIREKYLGQIMPENPLRNIPGGRDLMPELRTIQVLVTPELYADLQLMEYIKTQAFPYQVEFQVLEIRPENFNVESTDYTSRLKGGWFND